MTALSVKAITPQIGAEIQGLNLARDLPDSIFEEVIAALHRHLVLVFPDQQITPKQQLAFARRFGEIEPPHPIFERVVDCPEVTVIEQKGRAGVYNDEWHTDVTFREKPAMASILMARVLPPVGGDTLWASMYAAYDALSAPMQRLVQDLSAVHDITEGFGDLVSADEGGLEKLRDLQRRFPPVVHPVVRTHPQTGRSALFVNRSFTTRLLGVNKIEGEHLLEMLLRHAEQSNFQMRLRWQPGMLVMWDNRCTQHFAASDFSPHHRLMHRVTILGDKPYFLKPN